MSGSVPVLARGDPLAEKTLPPELFESPVLFVEAFDRGLVPRLVALASRPEELADRRGALGVWYSGFLQGRLAAIERALDES